MLYTDYKPDSDNFSLPHLSDSPFKSLAKLNQRKLKKKVDQLIFTNLTYQTSQNEALRDSQPFSSVANSPVGQEKDFASQFIALTNQRDMMKRTSVGRKNSGQSEEDELSQLRKTHQHRPYDFEKASVLNISRNQLIQAKKHSLSIRENHKNQLHQLNLDLPALWEIGQSQIIIPCQNSKPDHNSSPLMKTDDDMYRESLRGKVVRDIVQRQKVVLAKKRYQACSLKHSTQPVTEDEESAPQQKYFYLNKNTVCDNMLNNMSKLPQKFIRKACTKFGLSRNLSPHVSINNYNDQRSQNGHYDATFRTQGQFYPKYNIKRRSSVNQSVHEYNILLAEIKNSIQPSQATIKKVHVVPKMQFTLRGDQCLTEKSISRCHSEKKLSPANNSTTASTRADSMQSTVQLSKICVNVGQSSIFDSNDPYSSSATKMKNQQQCTFNTIIDKYQSLMGKVRTGEGQISVKKRIVSRRRKENPFHPEEDDEPLPAIEFSQLSKYQGQMNELSKNWTINHATKGGNFREKQDQLIQEFHALK
ncbi:hypothetical protein FGO68_gene2897 [Halteria grandinella]|uniref:Uncharacterized protein n=1 Tax=Halteria grandinella TaxID=5974 RepID=A0A8J8NTS4_HALGN|nr:hypothetical protein FGO68_gene2897 [Halteria grandinella]